MSNRTDIEEEAAAKSRLMDRRAELEALVASSGDASRIVDLDQMRIGRLTRIDAIQSQAMAIETERRRAVELNRIESALRRIEKGDYGYCVACDGEIAPKRLEQDPATPTCVDCASRAR